MQEKREEAILFAPENRTEEILQNVCNILSTAKGSVPMDRNFGLSFGSADRAGAAAEARLIAETLDAIETYEPRANVKRITIERDAKNGRLVPRLEWSADE